jgi:hypothetical protein
MSQLRQISQLKFRIGDAFPAGNAEAQFLTAISSAYNDLIFVNGLLFVRPLPEWTLAERQYLLRTSFGHLWELSVTLKAWLQLEPIQLLVEGLPEDVRADLSKLLSLASPGEDPVAKTVASIRNNATWHYAKPDCIKPIARALREAADLEGLLEYEESTGSVRALFADEILLQITTQFFSDADGEAAVSTVYRDVSELMAAAIRLVRDLLVLYFSRLPPGVVQKVPISTEEHH